MVIREARKYGRDRAAVIIERQSRFDSFYSYVAEVEEWLVGKGYSEKQAHNLVRRPRYSIDVSAAHKTGKHPSNTALFIDVQEKALPQHTTKH